MRAGKCCNNLPKVLPKTKRKDLIHSICQYLWSKHTHHGQVEATSGVINGGVGMERTSTSPTSTNLLQPTTAEVLSGFPQKTGASRLFRNHL